MRPDFSETLRLVVGGIGIPVAFLLAVIAISGTAPVLMPVVALGSGCAVVLITGMFTMAVAGVDRPNLNLSFALLIGAAVTAFVLVLACLLTDIRAGTILLGWGVVAIAGFILAGRKGAISPCVTDYRDVASILAIAIITMAWCRVAAGAYPRMAETGIAPVWLDYFIHGTVILQFGGKIAEGRHAFLLVDQPFVFYHYASFMLPAAILQAFGMTGFAAATGVMLSLGLFLAALGVYVLGTTLGGRLAGIAAVVALIFLPEPSTYWIRNGFFGFNWLLFAAPGSGYGVAVATTVLALVGKASVTLSRRSLALAALLTITVFQFRVEIFALFAPTLILALIWRTKLSRSHGVPFAICLVVSGAFLAFAVIAIPPVRAGWLGISAVRPFIDFASRTQASGIYTHILSEGLPHLALVVGLILLAPSVLGWFMLVYPVALAMARGRLTAFDFFPAWCLLIFFLIALLAPIARGDTTDWQHRSFVLVYAIFVCWSVALIGRSIDLRRREPVVWAVFAVASALGISLSWREDPARPTFAWGAVFYNAPVARSVLDASAYMREHAAVGDVLAFNPMDATAIGTDTATQLGVLSDIPLYIARPMVQMTFYDDARRVVAAARLSQLADIALIKDFATLEAALRTIGIAWYVVSSDTALAFDPTRSRAAFTKDSLSVYHISRSEAGVP